MLRLILLIFLTRLSIAGYVIQDSYVPSNFFDMFDFFTGEDPTQGYGKFDHAYIRDHDLIKGSQLSRSAWSTRRWPFE